MSTYCGGMTTPPDFFIVHAIFVYGDDKVHAIDTLLFSVVAQPHNLLPLGPLSCLRLHMVQAIPHVIAATVPQMLLSDFLPERKEMRHLQNRRIVLFILKNIREYDLCWKEDNPMQRPYESHTCQVCAACLVQVH